MTTALTGGVRTLEQREELHNVRTPILTVQQTKRRHGAGVPAQWLYTEATLHLMSGIPLATKNETGGETGGEL